MHFLLGVHFPSGLTDVTVELFTPDNLDSAESVMVLCGPTVSHVGNNLVLGVDGVTPQMDASRNDYNVSRYMHTESRHSRPMSHCRNNVQTSQLNLCSVNVEHVRA